MRRARATPTRRPVPWSTQKGATGMNTRSRERIGLWALSAAPISAWLGFGSNGPMIVGDIVDPTATVPPVSQTSNLNKGS